jgi:hypothetical protein
VPINPIIQTRTCYFCHAHPHTPDNTYILTSGWEINNQYLIRVLLHFCKKSVGDRRKIFHVADGQAVNAWVLTLQPSLSNVMQQWLLVLIQVLLVGIGLTSIWQVCPFLMPSASAGRLSVHLLQQKSNVRTITHTTLWHEEQKFKSYLESNIQRAVNKKAMRKKKCIYQKYIHT